MIQPAAVHGRPLRFFVLLLAVWLGIRVVTWDSPWPTKFPAGAAAMVVAAPLSSRPAAARSERDDLSRGGQPMVLQPAIQTHLPPLTPAPSFSAGGDAVFANERVAAAQNLLSMDGMHALPLPTSLAGRYAKDSAPEDGAAGPEIAATRRTRRWHFDGWVQLRPGGDGGEGLPGQAATLGGSQAGAVVRFRLVDGPVDLGALARLGASPAQGAFPARQEAGVGLRVRPLANLPLSAQVEARLVREGTSLRMMPVALVAGGIDRRDLAKGFALRAYGEAGWAGGSQATWFADGQAAVEREITHFDLGKVCAGIGAWGGVQKGVSRVDVGPELALTLPIAGNATRLQLDYRVRVAGQARPASGPALTLSTGF